MKSRLCFGLLAAGLLFHSAFLAAAETRSIAGQWRVQLDPGRVGEAERWFDRDLTGTITFPGSTDEARLGTPNSARPTLDGLYRLFPYEGPAWFQYNLMIPGSWKGKRVALVLDACTGRQRSGSTASSCQARKTA